VGKILGGEQFLDEQFTVKRLGERLAATRPTILHLASHGQFTGSPDTSFIQAYDGLVSLNELERLLLESNSPLDLLALSACETAAGNSRAVLGLAGVAVRAGARSVLGTLWSVSDDVTLTAISDFYQNLKSGMSKARALQRAQVRQIQRQAHPLSWSPFVLIGL
jgi:CHAT domain-containing protein